MFKNLHRPSSKLVVSLSLLIILLAVSILFFLGRTPWCTCGEIWLWSGDIWSSHNSQHLTDPYTFTHLLHGIGFYFLLYILTPHLNMRTRFLIALALESGWEVFENTSFIIERYRETSISLQYYGDSIVNSLGDIVASIFGFALSSKLSPWIVVILFLLIETTLIFFLKDSLILNIVMLLFPSTTLKNWQLGL